MLKQTSMKKTKRNSQYANAKTYPGYPVLGDQSLTQSLPPHISLYLSLSLPPPTPYHVWAASLFSPI